MAPGAARGLGSAATVIGKGAPRSLDSEERRQRRLFLALFFAPGIAYLLLIRVLPAFFTLFLSFTEWKMTEQAAPHWVGLRNYIAILHDLGFLSSLGRTLGFTVVATAAEVALGVAIALFLRREFHGRDFVRTALLAPMVLTPAVIGMMWYILFHPEIGPINWLLGLLGFDPVGWLTDPAIALFSIVLTDVWHWTPFIFLLVYSAIQTIPLDLYEAAAVDGASHWQTAVRITLPLIKDTILVAALLRSMDAFEIFAEPFVMTGGGPGEATETLSIRIYKAAFSFFQMGYAGAMVVVSIAILVSLYMLYLRLARLHEES